MKYSISLYRRLFYRRLGGALLAAILLLSAHLAPTWGEWVIQELPLNTKVALKPSQGPLKQKEVPKMLSLCFYDGRYVSLYSFKVQPGKRYTVYEFFPCDGVQRSIQLMGQTPLTDNDAYLNLDYMKYWFKFPTRRSMVGKEASKWCTYRTNFTVDPSSEHTTVYVVAVFDRPDIENFIMIKYPADSDEGLSDSTKRIWGVALKKPFLLKNVPEASTPKPQSQSTITSTPTLTPLKTPVPTPGASFFLQEAPISGTGAPVLSYGSKVKAYIDKGDYDTFRVDFKGGLFIVSSQGSLDLVADLRDAKGITIARAGHDGSRNFFISKELPAGTYYIHIRVMYHGGEGSYVLVLGDGSAGEYHERRKGEGK